MLIGFLALVTLAGSRAEAQTLYKLTLKEARETAIQRHPQVQAAALLARAADEVPAQQAAARYPNIDAAVTGAAANERAVLAAGALSNSTVLSRAAAGFSVNQLVFDSGRTGRLVESARLRASAAHETATATRAEIILEVDRAYFTVLRSQALLTVAEQTVTTRRLVVEQAETFQKSGIKSGLDASIARYDLAGSELLLVKSQNDLRASYAALAAAIGSSDEHVFELADETLSPLPLAGTTEIVEAGLRDRPELKALQFERAAAFEFLEAEKSLDNPTVSLLWSAGWIPFRDALLRDRYNAGAINVSIPVFEGHLFKARQAEATFKAQALEQQLIDATNRVARDVRVARLGADTAYRRIELITRMVARAREARDLAQERYRLGLGSIVELSQTLLNLAAAETEHATAKFEVLTQRSVLDYYSGQLH